MIICMKNEDEWDEERAAFEKFLIKTNKIVVGLRN